MIYPNSRIVRYEYNSGLDTSISRLSFLADDNLGQVGTHLEEYSYLGENWCQFIFSLGATPAWA